MTTPIRFTTSFKDAVLQLRPLIEEFFPEPLVGHWAGLIFLMQIEMTLIEEEGEAARQQNVRIVRPRAAS